MGVDVCIGVRIKKVNPIMCISFKFPGLSAFCLNRLKSNCSPGTEMYKGCSEASLAFAIFTQVKASVASSADKSAKFKISNIDCSATDGCLNIVFDCSGSFNDLIRLCRVSLTSINLSRATAEYSKNMKYLCGKKGTNEDFEYSAGVALNGLSKICVVIIGKIKLDDKKIKEANTRLNAIKFSGKFAGKKPNTDSKPPEQVVINCSGMSCPFVAEYLTEKRIAVSVSEAGVVVHSTNWGSKQNSIGDKTAIKAIIDREKKKLKDDMKTAKAYHAISYSFCSAFVAEKILKTGTIDYVSLISECLK
jgi:hypothetical protein